jgi:hypothetical protein
VERAFYCTVFFMFSLISASAEDGFGVMPDQYSRVLQLMKAIGVFNSYTHSCEMQSDGTGYRCEDHLDKIVVVYCADNEKTQINSVTVGALPENTDRAAALAATAALSLNAKFQSLPPASPTVLKIFRSLQVEIQTKMERVFVSGGSDLGATKDAMFIYLSNNNRDMSLVRVTPLKKD